tara:strand:+ start:748 stop:1017 length:270 start_codon:yes stop_codon:yes gene_type:complete
MKFTFNNRTYQHFSPRVGDDVAFYRSDDERNYFAAKVTKVLQKDRVHLCVYAPDGISVRKRVDPLNGDERLKDRWCHIEIAYKIEDDNA